MDAALAAAILGLIVVCLSAQGAIWYKLGRVEAKMSSHLQAHIRGVLTDGDGS